MSESQTTPDVVTREQAREMDSRSLYVLERSGQICKAVLDERVIAWTQEGWTQQRMADEIGCSRQAISKRQIRLEIVPSEPHPSRRISNPVANSENGEKDNPADSDGNCFTIPLRPAKPAPPGELADYLPDMLRGAEPNGAFRQTVKAWCGQERAISSAMSETGIELVPKSAADRDAFLVRLAEVHETATQLERQLNE